MIPYVIAQLPDMTAPEAVWLGLNCPRGSRVWEWGSGGSTVYLASLGCKITSIEHNTLCAEVLTVGVSQAETKYLIDLRLVGARADYEDRMGADGTYEQFGDYVDAYQGQPVDVALVDGRARMACLERLRKCAPESTKVFLHDAERYDYSAIAERVLAVGQLHQLRFKR